MRIKFNPIPLILQVVSCYYLVYKLQSVGVPDWLVMSVSIPYSIFFPWKSITVIGVEDKNENPK